MRNALTEATSRLNGLPQDVRCARESSDIVDVPFALATERGATLDNIVDVTQRKHAERGGFEMRLRLDGADLSQ
jgi:hypothetical protein